MRKTGNRQTGILRTSSKALLTGAMGLLVSSAAFAGFSGSWDLAQIQSAESQWQKSYIEADQKEFIIKLKSPLIARSMQQTELLSGLTIQETYVKGNYVVASFGGELEQIKSQVIEIAANAEVEYIVPNLNLQALDLFIADKPNDPKYSKQYALEKVQAEAAWEYTKGSKEVVVAVIDTGVDYTHEDLEGQIWENKAEIAGNDKDDDGNGFVDDVRGWDFDDADNDPMDDTSDGFFGFGGNPGHGTHCAGIIGATGDNEIGISGMAQNITIMPIRFLNENGSGNLANSIKAIDYAIDNGAHIISASWGGSFPESVSAPIAEAIERAEKAGVIFVAAAANSGANNDKENYFPTNAPYKNVISVAATGQNDKKASFSNYGIENVHVGAPGVDILSTLPDNEYDTLSGTSMATPLVAGLIALQFSISDDDGRRDPAAVKALLQSTGAVNDMEVACNCRVDAGAALESLDADELLIVPNTVSSDLGSKIELAAIGGEAPYRFEVANQKVGSIDAKEDGSIVFTGNETGKTKIVAYDTNGKRAITGLIRIRKEVKPGDECTMGSFICGIQCWFNPSLPFCEE